MYYTVRSPAKAQKTLEDIIAKCPGVKQEKIAWLTMDLTDVKSITTAADELARRESKVNILSEFPGLTSHKA